MMMMDVPGDNEWLDLLTDQVVSLHPQRHQHPCLGIPAVGAAQLVATQGRSLSRPSRRGEEGTSRPAHGFHDGRTT